VLEPRQSEATQGNGSLRYLFEEYAFDTNRRELHRGADVVSVAPQVFDLLDYLIRNRERVVSKEDLINAIWNGRIVSDAALTTRLNAARSVIGDTGEEQRFIKTLPRKGFRFVGPVLEAQGPAGPATADNAIEPPRPALTLPDKPSIAILPFTNLSSDPEQDYFADGMVEEIITRAVAFPTAVRDRPQFELHLQGARRRCEAGRARAWGALRAGRERSQSGKPGAHYGTARRYRHWGTSLGRSV
jgi:DNA-binding winged helix-turn-helix (wHTH) protein